MSKHFSSPAKTFAAVAVLITALSAHPPYAQGEVTCIAATNTVVKGKVVTSLSTKKRSTSCKKGEVPALTGPTGANGQLRVYGNGSAGHLVVSADGNLFTKYVTNNNVQFKSITVNAEKTLIIPGGTVLRATGDVTINGGIVVTLQGSGGRLIHNAGTFSATASPSRMLPALGVARTMATFGEIGSSSGYRSGGVGGLEQLAIFDNGTISNQLLSGGGGGASAKLGFLGGFGGGALMIIAGGKITINPTGYIVADGGTPGGDGDGAGGGGGGVVVLASRSSVSAAGSIYARGSRGNEGGEQSGSGGGGGGGIVILAAPVVDDPVSVKVNGGEGGPPTAPGEVTQNFRIGGGGGGASGGRGGNGTGVSTDGTSSAGDDGEPGKLITIVADPTALL